MPFIQPLERAGWGLLATSDTYIIKELERCIREQRGGVQEITLEEYGDLKKKENQTLRPTWRESISRSRLARLLARLHDESVAAAKAPAEIMRNFSEARALAKPQGKSAWRPTARKALA